MQRLYEDKCDDNKKTQDARNAAHHNEEDSERCRSNKFMLSESNQISTRASETIYVYIYFIQKIEYK